MLQHLGKHGKAVSDVQQHY